MSPPRAERTAVIDSRPRELAAVLEAGGDGLRTLLERTERRLVEIARRKAPGIEFRAGNALALDFDDDRFDAATVGFGARNFDDLDQGLREMARVVTPGGRVVVLEITTPQKPPLSFFFRLWFDSVVPLIGRVAGDPDAYEYLPNSVKRFPGPHDLAGRMVAAGMREVRWVLTAGGIIAIHSGTVT